jgi:hypothetical protein
VDLASFTTKVLTDQGTVSLIAQCDEGYRASNDVIRGRTHYCNSVSPCPLLAFIVRTAGPREQAERGKSETLNEAIGKPMHDLRSMSKSKSKSKIAF